MADRYLLTLICFNRFALQLEVGMPTAKQREAILRIYLEKQALDSAMFQESVGIAESLSKVKSCYPSC